MSLTAYAVIAGAGLAAIMQAWFGVLQGDYLVNASAIALSLFATGAAIVGLAALIGPPGIAIGAIITLLIGNPISAAAQPLEFLPEPWGAIGQWFVPGASVTLLRDLSYFPEANATMPWLVLAGWSLVGVALMFAGRYRNAAVVHDEAALEPEGPASWSSRARRRLGLDQPAQGGTKELLRCKTTNGVAFAHQTLVGRRKMANACSRGAQAICT